MRNPSGYQAASRAARRTATAGVMAAVMVAVLLQIVSPAQATNFGATTCGGDPRNCVSLGNNAYHVVRWEGDQDIAGIGPSLWWSVNNVYNPTGMVVYEDNADPLPDVRVWDEPYGPNEILGWVECPTDNTGTGGSGAARWCRGQILRLNSTYAADFDTEAERRRITCHELGHTVGLRHSASTATCMYTYPTAATTTGLDAHDLGHINSQY
ncbi:matrixin family metalloprotease [Plantactinospora sp. DSM 117369]